MNSLLYAVRPLVADFLPTIVFAALLAAHLSIPMATAVALVVGVAEVAYQKWRRQPVDLLQWASLALVVVFGGLGILTQDARFLMLKPTLIYVAIGVVMLKPGWMVRYLPPRAGDHANGLMFAWGYAWSALMFATAAANAVIAWTAPHLWPAFTAIVPLSSKLVLFAINYASVRFIVRRRILAQQAAPSQLAAA